jgi:hypothetical protein
MKAVTGHGILMECFFFREKYQSATSGAENIGCEERKVFYYLLF